MQFTRGVRVLFGGMTGLVLAFLYLPLLIIVVLVVQHRQLLVVAAEGLHVALVARGGAQHRRPRRADRQSEDGDRGDADRARARPLGLARRPAIQVLRTRGAEPDDRAADRVARHRHRHRAQRGVPSGRPRVRLSDADHRPRHVLHRRALQQPAGPVPATVAEPGGGLGRPRRRTRSRPSAT